jgi:hypothetical protein
VIQRSVHVHVAQIIWIVASQVNAKRQAVVVQMVAAMIVFASKKFTKLNKLKAFNQNYFNQITLNKKKKIFQ